MCYFTSLHYPTYYSEISVSISGSRMVKTHTLSTSSNCSSPYYEFQTTWDISNARTQTVSPFIIEVDYKVVSYKFKALHAYYTTQGYCGVSNWVVGVFAEVTGLDCPIFNPSPGGSTYLMPDDFEYEIIQIGTNAISVIGKENEVGHTEGQRRETGLVEILKL